MKRYAGVLVATVDPHARDVKVLVGKLKRRHGGQLGMPSEWLEMMEVGNVWFHDCWSIPFGTMDAEDAGNFVHCAVRELAEEVVPGADGFGLDPGEIFRLCDKWAALREKSVLDLVSSSRFYTCTMDTLADRMGLGDMLRAARQHPEHMPFELARVEFESRCFFAATPTMPNNFVTPKEEFEDGTFKWVTPAELRKMNPLHFNLLPTLDFFIEELAALRMGVKTGEGS